MGREVIKTLEWIDVDDEGQEPHSRAVATTTTNRGRDTNTLILFPPFFPLDPNKDIAPADYWKTNEILSNKTIIIHSSEI